MKNLGVSILLLCVSSLGLTAGSFNKTSFYVAYDSGDTTQYVLVLPNVQKVYTHKAGDILNLSSVGESFDSFPTYNNGNLCFSALKAENSGESGASLMANKCYDVKFFYIQKKSISRGTVFILYFKPSERVYEGLAGDASSFQIVKDGNIIDNSKSLTQDDYSHFSFDIGTGIASIETKIDINSSELSQKMTIKGKSTLAQAVVCLDSNKNSFCDEDEPQSTSDVIGKYLFEAEVKDGDIILSQGGYNLILLEKNTQKLAIKASFNTKNEETNLHTLSTLIADSIEKDGSYEKAKERIANKNGLDITLIEKNPIDLVEANEDDKIFLTIRAIEERILHPEKVESKKQKLSLNKIVNETLVITEEEADTALFGYDIFSFDLINFIKELPETFAVTIHHHF